jgi:hypothetical protein
VCDGCGAVETVHHLFVSCPIFSDVWPLVQQWIGVYGVDPLDTHQHFIQFIYLSGRSTKSRSFMQLLWLLCVWVIWSERNNKLFQNKVSNTQQLVDKIKIHSYWWMKAANAVYVLGVHNWLVCPLDCLDTC